MSAGEVDGRSEQLRDWVLEAVDDMKALEAVVLPVGVQSTVADFFVLCTGTSDTHCRAIAAEIRKRLKGEGIRPINSGEQSSAAWTLLDFGSVVVHVFSREARSKYNLEEVWSGRTAEGALESGRGPDA